MWKKSKFNNNKNITEVVFGSLSLTWMCFNAFFVISTLTVYLFIEPTPNATFSLQNYV